MTKTGGRKKGTPNKATSIVREAILKADPIACLIDIMKSAENENNRVRAAEFLAKRVAPEIKEQPVNFIVGAMNGVKDAQAAMANVVKALGAGDITPSQASSICGVIQNYVKAFEVGELAEQLNAIETQLKAQGVLDS